MAEHEKPQVSYVYMIQEAIKQSIDGKLTLACIYRYIEEKYPYFKNLTGKKRQSWQNSVRHNLSLNDCFIKIPKEGDGNERKGNFWMLDKSCEDQFEPGNCKRRRRMKRVSKSPYMDEPWIVWGRVGNGGVDQWDHTQATITNQPFTAPMDNVRYCPYPTVSTTNQTACHLPAVNTMMGSESAPAAGLNFCLPGYYAPAYQHQNSATF